MLKKLIIILGANGIGKSTTSKIFMERFERTALVDADWCRAINPFLFTSATKETVTQNIYCLFKNYLLCKDIDTIIFPYSFHGERKGIFDSIIERLRNDNFSFELHPVILKCSIDENIKRAMKDGRDKARIERGVRNTFSYYNDFDYPCIVTTNLTPTEVVEEISKITN